MRNRSLALLAAGCVGAMAYWQESSGGALAAERALICTNPASGTQWQIRVDYERSTVDSYPARITEGGISWHDTSDGGNYTLDRRSGDLTVVVASSTGGYFLHDRCTLDN